MDKPLVDKDKDTKAKEPETTVSAAPAEDKAASKSADAAKETSPDTAKAPSPDAIPLGDQPLGAYGAQTTRPLVTKEAWKEVDPNRPWMDDPKTRLGIRMFSRGILGAAFFAAGGQLTKKWMQGGLLNSGEGVYNASKGLTEQSNPLQFMAKLIDTVVGKPIEAAVTATMGKQAGVRSVRFRPTHYQRWGENTLRGRSLGNEAVSITFDFFCASVGDAWGRDIAGWFDPNVKKSWTDDKGNIQIPKAIDAATKALSRYLTYNGGEDWAVAIPYAYFMKAQRSIINKHSPGFNYDFDRQINGASFKVANNKIVGNFNLEGMIDLQTRFTAYNIGTLMYREAYDYVQNKMAGKPDSLYGAQDKEPKKDLFGKAGDLLKWAARSAIKGAIIMTPAVPFFWITRTPQNKHRGAFIDPEQGILGNIKNNYGIRADTGPLNPNMALEYRQYHRTLQPNAQGLYDTMNSSPPITAKDFHNGVFTQPHPADTARANFNAYSQTHGIADYALNAAGSASYQSSKWLDKPADWVEKKYPSFGTGFNKTFEIRNMRNFTGTMIKASTSYTPYMYAKAEFANLWDNGKMDMAAERMIDGAVAFNWKEFKSGAYEVFNSVLHKPLESPERDAEAHRRDLIDTSAPDIFHTTQAGMEKETHEARLEAERQQKQKGNLSWQERVISAKQEPKAVTQKETVAAQVPSPKKHTDQEAMRKALEELKPPTNSIN